MPTRPPTRTPSRTLDGQIDRLYQLPLDEFTAARNALAKETGDAEVKRLQKPPVAAWAINQVFWSQRPIFEAFTASVSALRHANAAVLAGKKADLRASGKAHDGALDAVLKAALNVLEESGQPATDQTKQAIASTLRALPSPDDEPGRLSRVLQPTGFGFLTGLPSGGGAEPTAPRSPVSKPEPRGPASKGQEADERAKQAARQRAVAAAKEAWAEAVREEKAAEQHVRREEFEAARTTREAERADARLEEAREELARAQAAVDEAETEASAAGRKRDANGRKVKDAADALARARVRAGAARAEMERIEKH